MLWTSRYIDAAVEQLRAEGHEIRDEDIARLSRGAAADLACPACEEDGTGRCQGAEWMVYDLDTDRCGWPVDTECVTP